MIHLQGLLLEHDVERGDNGVHTLGRGTPIFWSRGAHEGLTGLETARNLFGPNVAVYVERRAHIPARHRPGGP